MKIAKITDKQQEDLDLPYLQGNQEQEQAVGMMGGHNSQPLATSQSHSALALTGSQSLANQQALAAAKLAQPARPTADSVQTAGTLDSGSSRLSSVALASGAQMKQIVGSGVELVEELADKQAKQKTQADNLADLQLRSVEASDVSKLEAAAKLKQEQSDLASSNDTAKQDDSALGSLGRDPQIQTPKPRISELKQLLRHTNSLNQLPEFGVETEDEEQLGQLMEQVDVWGLNIFEVHEFSQKHSLTVIMFKIFKVS